ncbi:MAG: hypothetical protein ABI906_09540 [Pseudomonadota bacterium]
MNLITSIGVAGAVLLMLIGCGIVVFCCRIAWVAYGFALMFGLAHIRYLDIVAAGEVTALFALGVAFFGLGLRLVWRRINA